MQDVIQDYSKAIEAHIKAVQNEAQARIESEKTRHLVLMAKDAMRAKELELMEL